jgi:hypothetical protein
MTPENPPILPEELARDVRTVHEALTKLHQMGATSTAERGLSAIERVSFILQYLPDKIANDYRK